MAVARPRAFVAMNSMRVALAGMLLLASATASSGTLKSGDVAPAHLGTTLDGAPVLVTDFPGKVVIVSYWATWCTFCVKELAMLDAIQTAASEHVQVVAVNIESASAFRKVAKKLDPLDVALLYDPNKKGRKAYGVGGIPHMVIIGKDGRIKTVNIGYGEEDLDDILATINQAIGAIPAE